MLFKRRKGDMDMASKTDKRSIESEMILFLSVGGDPITREFSFEELKPLLKKLRLI